MSQINALVEGTGTASWGRGRVLSAIQNASTRTGVDFAYLVNKATQESSLDPTAKASGSSATGLYQFIDQTWLKTVKEHGAEAGLSALADKITISSNGVARVADPNDKKAILALRKDPEIASMMAASLAKDNKESLQRTVGGNIGATDLYMAHFLGAGGATAFLKTMKVNPDAKAAEIFPQAAAANPGVFYDKASGQSKSLKQIYASFEKKFDGIAPSIETQVAQSTPTSKNPPPPILAPTGSNTISVQRRALASLETPTIDQTMTLSNGVQLGQTAASPFAAMMIAQMDMETFSLNALAQTDKMLTSDEERKKSVFSTLAQVG